MKDQNEFKKFKDNFFQIINNTNCRRNSLKNKCFSAFVRETSIGKKIGILFGSEIFDENKKYNNKIMLSDIQLTEIAIKLLNESFENKINPKDFIDKFFNISEVVNFFYHFSIKYANLFLNENDWYDIFISFLFQNKYDELKIDIIKYIGYLINNIIYKKYKYEEFIKIINENVKFLNKNLSNLDKLKEEESVKKIIEITTNINLKKEQEIIDINDNNQINNIDNQINKDNNNIIKNNHENIKKIEDKNTNTNESMITDNKDNFIQISNNTSNLNNNDHLISKDSNENSNINEIEENNKKKEDKNIEDNKEEINTNSKDNNNTSNVNNIYQLISKNPNENSYTNEIEENNKEENSNKSIMSDNKKKFNIINNENSPTKGEIKINNSSDVTNPCTINKLKTELKTVEQYLNEKLKYYNDKYNNKYDLNILKYRLNHNLPFIKDDISYTYNIKFEPRKKLNDKVLQNLLDNLQLNEHAPNTSEYGYFCYEDKNELIEALYSTINSELLYDDITKYNIPDDFINPKKYIQDAYIQSRAKSFEYYIDKTIFEKRYNNKRYPRIIYPLKKLYTDDPLKYEYNFYESEKEIDGCYYINDKNFTIDKDEFSFQSQYCKSFYRNINDLNNDIGNEYLFLVGDLCLIEIKAKFPKKEKDYNDEEKDLNDTVIDMLQKMIIFEQLFKDLGINYKRIRLILFYDLIKKKNYEKYLENIFKKFKNKYPNLDYKDKIYFQIIYMDSSYFASSLKSFQDTIDNLNKKVEILSKDNEKLKIVNQKHEKLFEILFENADEVTKKKYNDLMEKNK